MTILYSQCWEDPRLLSQSLAVDPRDDVLSIASAGDNTLALLLEDPASITAIDFNPAQCHLLELKARAIERLDYRSMIEFVGARASDRRLEVYSRLRSHLTAVARAYWDDRPADLQGGIIHCGRLERYLHRFRRYVLPCIHGRDTIEQLLKTASPQAQQAFYRETWDGARWRILFRLFFSRAVMSRMGRRATFFRHAEGSDLASVLLRRARFGLTQVNVRDNYFLEYMLTGTYRNLCQAPPYLSPGAFDILRERLGRLRIVCGGLDRFLGGAAPYSFSKFNLSDIFEYMSKPQQQHTWRQIEQVATPGALAAYWSLFVPAVLTSEPKRALHPVWLTATGGRPHDRGFFYGDFRARPAGVTS